jgi:hypothetical protein
MRDKLFSKKSVSFLHQASRYRGKANYRDAIYLAYGNSVSARLVGFIDDLASVLQGFTVMAAGYTSARMGQSLWKDFIDDLEAKKAISISSKLIWP